jgi:hypothetical protein
VVAILLLALVGYAIWVSNVEPLGRGSFGSGIQDPRVQASERSVDAFGVSGLINTVKVQKGTTFTYLVSIRNDGPVPVTIKDIGMRGGAITTRVVAVNLLPYQNGGPARGFIPFAAFRLDPHEDAIIEMEAQVGANACVEGRGFSSWFQEPITYTIFGITRHSSVETGTEIRLVGTTEGRTGAERRRSDQWNEWPQAHPPCAAGLSIVKPVCSSESMKSTVACER